EQRLKAKDDLVDDYRRRCQIVPPKGGELTALTNAELKKRSFDFVSALRKWRTTRLKEEGIENDQFSSKLSQHSMDHEQWRRISNEMFEASMKHTRDDMIDYDENFKVTAIMLRDEIITRLPKDKRIERAFPVRFRYLDYEIPHEGLCTTVRRL